MFRALTVSLLAGLIVTIPFRAVCKEQVPVVKQSDTGTPASGKESASATGTPRYLRCPDTKLLTDKIVAGSINVSVERLNKLKAARSLTNDQICSMPDKALKRAFSKLDNPKQPKQTDKPDKWAEFRTLQRRSDDGNVKPDGLMKGFEHRQVVLEKIAEKKRNKEKNGAGGKPGTQQITSAPAEAVPVADPLSAAVDISQAGIASNQWTSLGPGNVGGRIRAIAIHPTDTASIWLGGVSGGIWHSSDQGASWSPVNDFMANLAVSCIIIDPGNPEVMYAGTGEGFFNADAVRGYGVYKSTDGGVTWNFLTATTPSTTIGSAAYGWFYVNKLAISNDGSTILAATRGYYSNYGNIWRSTDGGASWTSAYNSGRVLDVRFDPNDATKAIATAITYNFTTSQWESHILTSVNGGQSWTAQKKFAPSTSRIELAYAPSNSQTVYASVDNNSGEVWKSTNGGTTWALVSTPQHLGNQGWYDNTIWVDPTNASHVVAAGLDIWRSTNGGVNWTKISNWVNNMYNGYPQVPHADHHVLVADPGYNGTTNRILYNCNDGGIFRAPDITAATQTSGWTRLNNNLAITQFFSVAGHSAAGSMIIGGTQDNGSLMNSGPGTNWSLFNGGDGGFSAVDATNDNYLYGEYVYLEICRSTNRGATCTDIDKTGSFPITDSRSDVTANFIAPFILDPNDSNRMLAGGRSLWQNIAVRSSTSWSAIKSSIGSNISAIAVAEGNSNIVWVGHTNGAVYRTSNSLSPTPTWTLVSPGPARMVNRILIDRDDPTKAYVAFGGYNSDNLYRTINNGAGWTNLNPGGVLPAVPCFALAQHPANAAWLYAGTEVGLFTSQDGGTTWSTSNDGPANVEISELVWRDSTTLLAATHGRGIFLATASIMTDTATALTASPNPSTGGQSVTFTATVTPSGATGTVTFYDGATTLGSASLSSGVATYSTAALGAGSHSISAAYGGDSSYNGSSSTILTHTVNPAILPEIVTNLLPHALVSTGYSQTLVATGGTAPLTWTIASGALPPGMNLTGSSGLIAGTPTASGVFSFVARVTDAFNNPASASLAITVSTGVCANDPVRISGVTYPDIPTAYQWAANGNSIELQAFDYLSDLMLDRNISVSLDGGYDCGYTANAATTALLGKLRISNGTVNVDNVRFR